VRKKGKHLRSQVTSGVGANCKIVNGERREGEGSISPGMQNKGGN